jgi:hypothetical protein
LAYLQAEERQGQQPPPSLQIFDAALLGEPRQASRKKALGDGATA